MRTINGLAKIYSENHQEYKWLCCWSTALSFLWLDSAVLLCLTYPCRGGMDAPVRMCPSSFSVTLQLSTPQIWENPSQFLSKQSGNNGTQTLTSWVTGRKDWLCLYEPLDMNHWPTLGLSGTVCSLRCLEYKELLSESSGSKAGSSQQFCLFCPLHSKYLSTSPLNLAKSGLPLPLKVANSLS